MIDLLGYFMTIQLLSTTIGTIVYIIEYKGTSKKLKNQIDQLKHQYEVLQQENYALRLTKTNAKNKKEEKKGTSTWPDVNQLSVATKTTTTEAANVSKTFNAFQSLSNNAAATSLSIQQASQQAWLLAQTAQCCAADAHQLDKYRSCTAATGGLGEVGKVCIFEDNRWKPATPYMWTGTHWQKIAPYVWTR